MDIKDIAKEIRVILANNFYKTKFSVKCSRFSQGSSVDITWTDGPTVGQVDELVEQFKELRTRFISTNRKYSAQFIDNAIAAWKQLHPAHASLAPSCLKDTTTYYAGFEMDHFMNTDLSMRVFEWSMQEIISNSAIQNNGEFILLNQNLPSNQELKDLYTAQQPESEVIEQISEIASGETEETEQPETNLIQFPTPAKSEPQPQQTQSDDYYLAKYKEWVDKLVSKGEYHRIKSYEEWYAIAIEVM